MSTEDVEGLANFSKNGEVFERQGVSFAQFEREVTGERIHDKIAASKCKGLWMGSVLPLGISLPAGLGAQRQGGKPIDKGLIYKQISIGFELGR